MTLKLRWLTPAGTTTKAPVLQFWRNNPRTSECAGVDYSEDGEWVDVPIVVAPPPSPYVHDFAQCTKKLRAQGVAYPRTCAECGLGPCRA